MPLHYSTPRVQTIKLRIYFASITRCFAKIARDTSPSLSLSKIYLRARNQNRCVYHQRHAQRIERKLIAERLVFKEISFVVLISAKKLILDKIQFSANYARFMPSIISSARDSRFADIDTGRAPNSIAWTTRLLNLRRLILRFRVSSTFLLPIPVLAKVTIARSQDKALRKFRRRLVRARARTPAYK